MSSSNGDAGPSVVDEETADEVKVFRSNNAEDDPTELAGSSADLDADKQELAMEADIEMQSNIGQSFNAMANPLSVPLPWPSPGSNFLFNQLIAAASLSPACNPVFKAATVMAAQQLATAAATAALVARHSPNYMNLGTSFGMNPFERPPNFFSQPSTPSTAHHSRNSQLGHQTSNGTQQLNSPMSTLGGGFGGMSLATGEMPQQLQKGIPSQMRTPKREKTERKEKQHQQREEKKDHIKKPMNAFMLFMKANRHKYLEESLDKRKQSAELNKELGQIWQQMSREAQQPYYEMAQKAKEEHARMVRSLKHPQWSARENYAIHKRAKKKRVREKSVDNNEQKKCRARFGVDNLAKWCKHCRRKKRCLNVLRDSDSPVQVSSTTNPNTLSIGLSSSAHFGGASLGGILSSAQLQQLGSPHSRKDRDGTGAPTTSSSTNNSERTTVSRCSSVQSSGAEFSSNVSVESAMLDDEKMEQDQNEQGKATEDKDRTMVANGEGMETARIKEEGATTSNGFKVELGQQQQTHHNQLSVVNQSSLPPHMNSIGSSLADMAKPLANLQHPFQTSPSFPFPSNFGQNPFIPPFTRFF